MLKTLKRDDTTTTPYVATKNWNLSNVANTDLVLAENGNPVGVENVIYHYTYVETASLCGVAKEDQENDLARYREGIKKSGLFYPDQEQTNLDGTYKRIVYSQIKTMFYNNYRDPTKMWGMEKIDFDTSGVKKFLSDYIKVFDIPTNVMGENIVKNSVIFTDNSVDNDYTITDDGNCNLFAGTNLFSKQQMVGYFGNMFITGSSDTCNDYFSFITFSIPPSPLVPDGPINLTVVSGSSILNWNSSSNNQDFFAIQRSLDGLTYYDLSSVNPLGVEFISNGGFEAGNFTSWTVVDNTPGGGNITIDTFPQYVHSGTYGVSAGPWQFQTGYISQVLTTGVGNNYTLTFWLNAVNGGTIFQVYWEGNLIADLSMVLPLVWTQYTYSVTSTAATSEIKFLMENEPGYFGLDDISISGPGTILPETYTDTDVSSSIIGNTYWYRVAGVNTYGTSSFSNTASITFVSPSELQFKICDWANVSFSAVSGFLGQPSPEPQWNGVFTNLGSAVGSSVYYFTGQSISGISASADHSIGWPSLTNLDYTRLSWNGSNAWTLNLTANQGGGIGSSTWVGTNSTGVISVNPAGWYTASSGAPAHILIINTNELCPGIALPAFCVPPPFLAYGISGSTTTPKPI